ncbi:insect cuticle protein domain-containing protein [Phthorimaea operculella]|nr:insect cuticle protein domain-containing protein [Phthorimaea operculella]
MKFLIVLAIVVAAASAQYRPFGRSNSFAAPRQVRAPATTGDRDAQVLRYDNEVNPDSFRYSYETSNGIAGEAQGNADSAQGSYSYTAPDGQQISLTYNADANGFQPSGAHLPVGPPVPDYILRSIEYIRTHPQRFLQAPSVITGGLRGACPPHRRRRQTSVAGFLQAPSVITGGLRGLAPLTDEDVKRLLQDSYKHQVSLPGLRACSPHRRRCETSVAGFLQAPSVITGGLRGLAPLTDEDVKRLLQDSYKHQVSLPGG